MDLVRDLTDPAQGPHALQLLVDLAVAALCDRWNVAVRRHRRSPVVDVRDNYDRLRIPPEAVSRDARYSHYVDARRMLRGHTSAMVPPALRALAAENDPPPDVLLVCPGVVYRRDAIDRLHTGTPHQLDLWRLTRRPAAAMTTADLDEMVAALARALVPGRRWQAEPRTHPYTLEGRQVDVGGIEVWECGLAHPEVLAAAGLDPDRWSGLALGMGLDRLLMLRKGIPDIRLLRSPDPRIAGQLLNVDEPYRPVSTMPPVRRDVSVAVAATDAAEELGDRVREALGADADSVEEVAVLSETGYDDLPPRARVRLGIRSGEKNVLVRIVLRHLTRTLTDAEANAVRDRIYAALHAPLRSGRCPST